MILKRRGTFLVEMLTVIFMVGIGGSLMTVGLASLLRSQDRVVAFGNRLARVDAFLTSFERDVRTAGVVTLRDAQDEEPRQELLLGEPTAQVRYRVFEDHVERTAQGSEQLWSPMTVRMEIERGMGPGAGVAVGATVFLPRTDHHDPEPRRQFHVLVRCADERRHDE